MVDWIGQILDMSVEQPPKDELEDFCQRQVDYGYNIKVSFLDFRFSGVLQHSERSELHLHFEWTKVRIVQFEWKKMMGIRKRWNYRVEF